MDFSTKKLKVMSVLRDAELLESFDILQDDNELLCLRSLQQINESGANCLISLILFYDRAYSLIYYSIAQLNDPQKRTFVLNILNELNEDSLLVKYYIDSNNIIYGRINYIGVEKTFSSTEFVHIMKVGFSDIRDSYDIIMKAIDS